MIDNIKVVCYLSKPLLFKVKQKNKFSGIRFNPIVKEKIIVGYVGYIKNLRVFAYTNGFSLVVTNSLHKYAKNDNSTDFSFSEMENIINRLQKKYSWFAVTELKFLEFGINLQTELLKLDYSDTQMFKFYPKISVNTVKQKHFEFMKHGAMQKYLCYGLKAFFTDYNIKIYDKTMQMNIQYNRKIKDTIRFEIQYKKRGLKRLKLHSLNDLKDFETVQNLCNDFMQKIELIMFKNKEMDYSKLTPNQLKLVALFQNTELLRVLKEHNQRQFARYKKEFDKLQSDKIISKQFAKSVNEKIADLLNS